MTFVPASITLAGRFRVDKSSAEAFPLFSPRGEELWVPDWKPEILYPAGAEWEEGLVFRTVRGGQEAVWFVTTLDRDLHRVTYHRVDTGMTAVTVSVACDPAAGNGTEVRVRYTFVGLSDAGNEAVRARSQPEFDEWMRQWESMIAAMDEES